jgi:hypothetical protein
MSLLDSILNAQGGGAVQQLGTQFGLSNDQTTSALSALVPAIAAGLQNNAQSGGGLAGLIGALSSGQHEQYVNDPSTLANPSTTEDGNAILGHIFGSKAVSTQVASQASTQTGVSTDVLKQMLPVAAALAMGALARHHSSSGPVGSMPPAASGAMPNINLAQAGASVMSMLNSTLNQANAGGGGLGGLLGGLFGR